MSVREAALRNVNDTLTLAMDHDGSRASVILADERSPLSRVLLAAYRACLPDAQVLLYDETPQEAVKSALAALAPRDLTVLIQSTPFQIGDFRIRVELFRREIKV